MCYLQVYERCPIADEWCCHKVAKTSLQYKDSCHRVLLKDFLDQHTVRYCRRQIMPVMAQHIMFDVSGACAKLAYSIIYIKKYITRWTLATECCDIYNIYYS